MKSMKAFYLFITVICLLVAAPFAGAEMAGTNMDQSQFMTNQDFAFGPFMGNENVGFQSQATDGFAKGGEVAVDQFQYQNLQQGNAQMTPWSGKVTYGDVSMSESVNGGASGWGGFGANSFQLEKGETNLTSVGTGMTSDIFGKTFQTLEGGAIGNAGVSVGQDFIREAGYEQFKNTWNGTAHQYGELYQSGIQNGGASYIGGFDASAFQKAEGSTGTFYAAKPGYNVAAGGMEQGLCAAAGAKSWGNSGASGMITQTLSTGYTQQSANATSSILQSGRAQSMTMISY